MAHFTRSIAIIIGINQYQNGVPPLTTAVNDAFGVSQVLKADHGYRVVFMRDHQVTLASLKTLLVEKLPHIIQADDRFLFYFAGHGLAFNGDAGPEGYLIPQDATLGDSNTYLPMTLIHDSLTALSCRHFLGIFDCCFAGAFRWSATRRLTPIPKVIHKERFDRFLTDPAWQVLTSAADDQEAMDALSLKDHRGHTGHHSPFAEALINALKEQSQADASPPAQNGKPAGDGVITATELYQYLRDAVEPGTMEHAKRQTPGLWPLKKHGKGEYIFLVPGRKPDLPDAPKLDEAANPYRGLESFEEIHQHLFFGRKQLIQELQEFMESHPLTVVLGASGTGKSSLVKAGLVPALKQNLDMDGNPVWQVLPIVRPGVTPLKAVTQALGRHDLGRTLAHQETSAWGETLKTYLQQWQRQNPHQKLLLVIDQAEELFSLCREGAQREQFLEILAELLDQQSARFHIVLTLRSDFEPQFRNSVLEHHWSCDRFVIRSMNREELQAAIEAPAAAKVMYFDPPELVDRLIDEVYETPGALPLLSFTLRELFLRYLRDADNRTNRAITAADYEALGGIKQALVNRADEEYQALVQQDPAFADTIRRVMLRMVASGGTGNTRRQVLLSELDYPAPEADRVNQVLTRFKEARLLVSDTTADNEPYIEPAHDALVEGWPRLLQWLESSSQTKELAQQGWRRFFWNFRTNEDNTTLDEREKLLLQRRLTPAANDWHRAQKTKFLWHGDARLPLLKQIRKREPNWFNTTETDFVKRSLGRKRFNVSSRWLSMIGLLAASIVAGLFLYQTQQEAIRQRNIAETNRLQAEKRSAENLITTSKTQFEADQHLDALLAALDAAKVIQKNLELRDDSELLSQATFALHQAFYGNQELTRFSAQRAELSPSGKYVALVEEDTLRIWSNENYSYVTIQHQFTFDENQRIQQIEIDFNPSETQVMLSRYLSREVVKEDEVFGTTIIETVRDQHEARAWSLEGQEVEIDPLITRFTPNNVLAFTQSGLLRISDSKQFNFPQYSQIKFSSDGQKIAWGYNGKIEIANIEDLDNVEVSDDQPFDNEAEPMDLLGFIGDDQFVLVRRFNVDTGMRDKYQILDLSGTFIKDINLTTSPNGCNGEAGDEMLSPSGNFFVVKCRNGNVSIQEIVLSDIELSYSAKPPAQQLINVFEISNVSSDGFASSSISIAQDETRMLVSNSEGFRDISKLWMIQKEEIQQPLFSDTSDLEILSSDISSNMNVVAYVDRSGAVQLFHEDISEAQISQIPDKVVELPNNPLVRFSSPGQYFALVHDRKINLFYEDGTPVLDLSSNPAVLEHDDNVTSVNFAPDESLIVSTDSGGAIKAWDLQGVLIDSLKLDFPITSSAISPEGSRVAISYTDDLQHPLIEIRDLERLDGKALMTFEDEVISTPDVDRTIAPITEINFLNDEFLVFSNKDPYFGAGFGIKILDIKPGGVVSKISTRGSSAARQVSLHPLANLLTVMVVLDAHNSIGVGRLWSIDGEQLSDFSHLSFGQTPRDSFWGCFQEFIYPKCINEARFSSSGDVLAAIVQYDETGEYGVAVWDFNLDTLVDKSCDLLSNYLSGPLATDAEKQLCSDEPDQAGSQTSETTPNESISGPSTLPWYSLSRWLGAGQGEQSASTPSTEPADGSGKTSPTVSENNNFPTLTPSISQHIDLTGLGLTLNEQVSFQRLNTQALVWDIEGALESLIVLQNSDNQCVATFAEQFTQLLNQQDKEGFRQINPIKKELNKTQGCALPLVPFDFSPLSSD